MSPGGFGIARRAVGRTRTVSGRAVEDTTSGRRLGADCRAAATTFGENRTAFPRRQQRVAPIARYERTLTAGRRDGVHAVR